MKSSMPGKKDKKQLDADKQLQILFLYKKADLKLSENAIRVLL